MDLFDAVTVSKEKKNSGGGDGIGEMSAIATAVAPPSSNEGSPIIAPDETLDFQNRQAQQQRSGDVPTDEAKKSVLDASDEDDDANAGGENAVSSSSVSSIAEQRLFGETTMNPPPVYIKDRLLGSGAYGQAWLCKHSATGEWAVVKTMNLPGMSKKELSYAQSEIQCLANVRHPNIVKFHGSQSDGKLLVIAMEFADAGDLRKHIKARQAASKHLTESEAMFLFIQVALAILHIHSDSMLHRDIKSANILICTNGLVKVADFGFSRQYEDTVSQAVAKTFCGTPYYLAPELWKNKRYSNKAEVWSLGVLLYELLALSRPFNSASLRGLMDAVVSGDFDPLPPQFTHSASDLVATLLDVDATRRPTTLEIFQIPFVRQQLVVLLGLVQDNPLIADDLKAEWVAEANNVLQKTETLPAFTLRKKNQSSGGHSGGEGHHKHHHGHHASPTDGSGASSPGGKRHEAGAVDSEVTFEGPVKKLAALTKLRWSDRYLYLVRGELHLCEAKDVESNRRVLPVDQLQSVCPIAETSAKRKHVFAIHTKDAKCTWLQAPNEETRTHWVSGLQRAMGAI